MTFLSEDFNIKINRKEIFKPTTQNDSLKGTINDNGITVVNFTTSKIFVSQKYNVVTS
jgi:hypothetical protein